MKSRLKSLLFALVGALSARGGETFPRVTTVEVVTADAAVGDGGNAWGGHHCRIVRTRDGVFTAYTVAGKSDLSRQWKLAWRHEGKWQVAASGLAGREPVNLLASPDGTLHVIAWPEARARLWSGKPRDGSLLMTDESIPGLNEDHWAYGSAAISPAGEIFVLSSEGDKPGLFRIAKREAVSAAWETLGLAASYRHCYTYLLPGAGGSLSLVSTRDVKWETLGYVKPFDENDYVLNGFGLWHSYDMKNAEPRLIASVEEKPTRRHAAVLCTAQIDAYLDNKERIHVLYTRRGPATEGESELRHALFTNEGRRLQDDRVPWSAGTFARVFQDDDSVFYLLGSDGVIFQGDREGISFRNKTRLSFGGHQVEYAGFSIAAPRTGSAPGGVMDVVFPSGGGARWIYLQIALHGRN